MMSENTNKDIGNEETMDQKSRLKELNDTQKQKLRSAILMSFASILLLSGATFAWFTVGNTVRVKSLSLQVAAEGKLYISDTKEGLSKKETLLDLNMKDAQILYPATTKDGKTFLKPVYKSDNEVGGTKELGTDKTVLDEYRYEKDLWLIIDETGVNSNERTYDITLARKGTATDEDKIGTYVSAAAGATGNPHAAVRFSFEVVEPTSAENKLTVYEPNADIAASPSEIATDSSGFGLDSGIYVHKQNSTGEGIFTAETGKTYYEGDSSALFSMKPNTATHVILRVWFEGTDKQCGNDIEAQKIIGQLKFISHNQSDASKNE